MSDSVYSAASRKDFAIFGEQALSSEDITDDDLSPIEAISECPYRSMAWSSNLRWYFIIDDKGISLLNVHSRRGIQCKKKTWKFIQFSLEEGGNGNKSTA